MLELKQLILAEEARFRSVLLYYYIYPVGLAYFLVSRSVAAEIEAIRAGKWDAQIERRLGSDEYVTDRIALSSQSDVCVFYFSSESRVLNRHSSMQRSDVLAESGLDFTHMSEPSPSASPAQVTMLLNSVATL